jgi:hypothetical protein
MNRFDKWVSLLLDQEAPKTCEAIWQALPLEGEVFHAIHVGTEFYTLVPPFAEKEPGLENTTIVPKAGDLMYFHLPPGAHVPEEAAELGVAGGGIADLAVFYDRNNFPLNPTIRFIVGNVFATVVKNLDSITKAGRSIWREGAVGERLLFSRLQTEQLREWGLDP